MNENKNKKNILVVLVILALILGYWVNKRTPFDFSFFTKTSDTEEKFSQGDLSQDMVNLLNVPGPGATKEEIDAHSKLAAKLAFLGTEAQIRDCKPNHIVLQVKINSATMLKNVGSNDISISFDDKNKLNIPQNKSVDVSKAFVYGPGLYGYLCKENDFTGVTGFILVTP